MPSKARYLKTKEQLTIIVLLWLNTAFNMFLQDFSYECLTENKFSYFSTKTYVVGTQKNRLIETVLLSIQNKCLTLRVRKYLQIC